MSARVAMTTATPLVGDTGEGGTIPGAQNLTVGVVQFPGSLDERDAMRAVTLSGARALPLWHGSDSLSGVDAVILPGGFSYGDYLRCGAIARFAPLMTAVVDAAKGGMPVLGICNGFQVLCESHLLPGALIRNDHQRFVCRDQDLVIESAETAWTRDFTAGQTITIPLKNGEGGFVADDAGPAGRRRPGHRPVPRVQPQRFAARHRRHHERRGQRRGTHAPPGARCGGRVRNGFLSGHACGCRRAAVLHLRPAQPAPGVTAPLH